MTSRLLTVLGAALRERDGQTARAILAIERQGSEAIEPIVDDVLSNSFASLVSRSIPAAFASFVSNFLMSLARLRCASANHAAADAADDADAAAAAAAASVTAVDEARAAMAALKTAIRDERRTVWFLPLVDVGLTRLRLAAYAADAALTRTGARAHCAADSADTFMSWSRAIQADREEWRCSLKQGKLMVMNHLFKLYYHLGNVRRCADLIRNAEGVDLNLFPKAQAVTYQYYLGSTYLFEEDYARAEECLSFAAAHCHPAHARNQQRILYLLVPLRLLLGKPVSAAALRARGMDEYSALTEAVSRGDVGAYAACASDNRVLFIAKSVYLVVEKLQMTTYRNLLRRVHEKHIKPTAPAARAHIVPLPDIYAALSVVRAPLDEDQLECVLSNLIYAGAVKGYVAKGKALVLSKADPFP